MHIIFYQCSFHSFDVIPFNFFYIVSTIIISLVYIFLKNIWNCSSYVLCIKNTISFIFFLIYNQLANHLYGHVTRLKYLTRHSRYIHSFKLGGLWLVSDNVPFVTNLYRLTLCICWSPHNSSCALLLCSGCHDTTNSLWCICWYTAA